MELKTAKEMREVSRNTKFNKDFQRIIEDIAFSIDDCASKGYTTCKFRHEDLYYQGRKIADAVRNELEKHGFKVEYIYLRNKTLIINASLSLMVTELK